VKSLTPRIIAMERVAEIAEATVAKAKRLQYQKDPKEAEAAMKGKRKDYGSCKGEERLRNHGAVFLAPYAPPSYRKLMLATIRELVQTSSTRFIRKMGKSSVTS
jgi:hypothetical protein